MSDKDQMSFLEHLEELRWHLVRSIAAIVILAIVAFIFHNIIFDKIILAPNSPSFATNAFLKYLSDMWDTPALAINQVPFNIININMAGQFTTHIRVSIVAGIILGFPYIFYELWKFISPALHENERKYSGGAIFITSLLFFMGVLFGYFVIVPLSVHFLGHYNVSATVVNQINLQSYISTVTTISLAGGIIFELPVIIYVLSKIGIVTPAGLRKYRRHAVAGIVLLAAVITPPDVFSQILVSIPLIILYEVGIAISRGVFASKRRAEKE